MKRPHRSPPPLTRRDALIFLRGDEARFDGCADRRNHDAEVKRDLRRPLSRAFLSGFIQDEINKRLAGLFILHTENF